MKLSLVDLYLKGAVRLQYTNEKDETCDISKAAQTTPAMLHRAKSFSVTIVES